MLFVSEEQAQSRREAGNEGVEEEEEEDEDEDEDLARFPTFRLPPRRGTWQLKQTTYLGNDGGILFS